MIFGEGDEVSRCSFCSKSQSEVSRLIAGPNVWICDECINLCNAILADDARLAADEALLANVPSEDPDFQDETFLCPNCGHRMVWPASSDDLRS